MITYDTKYLLMHGRAWDGKKDLAGWIIQEKYNGCRAIWTGKHLVSRGGNVIEAPDFMLAELPKGLRVDGEIHAGRGGFQTASAFVNHGVWNDAIQYVVFDFPMRSTTYSRRTYDIVKIIGIGLWVKMAPSWLARASAEVLSLAASIQREGGEGVMAWNPNGFWKPGRTRDLLKVK